MDTARLRPVLDLLEGARHRGRDLGRLRADARQDEHDDEHRQHDDQENKKSSPGRARPSTRLQTVDEQPGDCTEHEADDQRLDDRRRLAKQPDGADEDEHHAHDEP